VRRREFIAVLGAAAAWPLAARAQQPEKIRLIAVLMAYAESDPAAQTGVAAFRDELAKLGWREGSNCQIAVRWAAGNADRFKAFANELVGLRPDVILSMSTVGTTSVVHETQTIPTVFVAVNDPIGSGFVANLAHPGGNVTGFMLDVSSLGGKQVELLKEIAPGTRHAALLSHPATSPSLKLFLPSIEAAASSYGIALNSAPIQAKEEIEGVIAAQASEPGGGLIVAPSAFGSVNRELIITLTSKYSLPAIYYERAFTDLGGLIAYSPDYFGGFGPAAGYVDRILKGAKPGDLPVQAPTKFELSINLKTAKALGVSIPPTILAIADKVIE
jgi:putative ABC transport system substrate-binding protein